MAQFFRSFFERKLLAKRLKFQSVDLEAKNLSKILQASSTYSKQYDPKNPIILFRLAQAELKALAMWPCPVASTTGKEAKSIIQSSKRLRNFTNVNQATSCQYCPLAETCKVRDMPPAEQQQQVDLSDIFAVLAGLYCQEDAARDIGVSQAAVTTASMLAETFEDLEENDGLEFKMLFNEVKKESQKRQQVAPLPPEKTKEEARDEIEQVEQLMDKLKKVSTRSERRRLMA